MIGSLAAFLGLVYFLLVAYNYPFTEPAAISSDSFKELQEYWRLDIVLVPPAK